MGMVRVTFFPLGILMVMVVTDFAMSSTLSMLKPIFALLSNLSNSLYNFRATKQMQMCASIRRHVKWNMGRISIFDLAMRKAFSTFQRLWYAVKTSSVGISVLVR